MTTVAKRAKAPFTDLLEWLESGTGLGLRGLAHTPQLRVEDFVEDGTYVLRAEMPGIDPDKDIELTVDHDQLTIHGERREEKRDRRHQEFWYGTFSRTVPMPWGLDPSDIDASYVDGVLEVRVPVATSDPDASPVKIPVQRPEGE